MIFLVIYVFCSSLNSLLLRLSEQHAPNGLSVLACNYVVCTLLAALNAKPLFPPTNEGGLAVSILLGCVAGILYLSTFVLLQWNISKNGVAMSATFMKLGVIIPTLLSLTLFREAPKAVQIIGILLAITAIVLIRLQKGTSRVQSSLGLILLLLLGGVTDSTSKMFAYWGKPAWQSCFLLCTFAVALLLCVGLCLWRKQGLTLMDMLYGALIGIPNYYCSHLFLRALKDVPALIAYPVASVGTIVVVALAGVVFFKEILSKQQKVALGIVMLSLVLLNL